MDTKNIKQVVNFSANPHEIYEMLMDSNKHAEFTGEDASISKEVGGHFSAYGNYIEGENKELILDKKIVQSWRASDWPEGHFSEIIFELEEKDGGTELNFKHNGIPKDQADDIDKGWHDHYWDKMKEQLSE